MRSRRRSSWQATWPLAVVGFWSEFRRTRYEVVALILVIFLSISGIVGLLFMPNTAGKSLEEIEAERSDDRRAATPEAVS